MSQSPMGNGLINLAFFRKQAKRLLQQMKSGLAPEKVEKLKQLNPSAAINLASAQWLIAVDLGFTNWPKLKSHVDTLTFSAQNPSFIADHEHLTIHWRCGHDIEHNLRIAGFSGQFIAFTDPFCMGPVPDIVFNEYKSLRTQYLSETFNLPLTSVVQQFDQEYQALKTLSDQQRIVIWCEADPYDQLFLVRFLSSLDKLPKKLELIDVASIPGVERFVGLGQLSPDVLAWLWSQRRPIMSSEIAIAKQVWQAFTQQTPHQLVQMAQQCFTGLPHLGAALKRMLLEYPNSSTGLSLTEKLTLTYIQEKQSASLEQIFKALTHEREPLPFLGDLMFYQLMRPLITSSTPLLIETQPQLPLVERPLRLSPIGEKILNGDVYARDYIKETRWIGGVSFKPKQAHWSISKRFELIAHN